MRFIFILFSLGFLGAAGTALAVTQSTVGGVLISTLTPAQPGPEQAVSVALTSPTVNLDLADIQWKLDGSIAAASGRGKKTFAFKTGELGSLQVLEISVREGIKSITTVINVIPTVLDLVWQADTAVPAQFKGKALAGPGSLVTLTALPEFKQGRTPLAPADLIYFWQNGFRDLPNSSGLGKQSLTLALTEGLAEQTVGVRVRSADGKLAAEAAVVIAPQAPKLLFYEDHPLRGLLLNRTLAASVNLTAEEIAVRAEPYYLSLPAPDWQVGWRLNGRLVPPTSADGQTIVLRRPAEGAGESVLRAEIRHLQNLLQATAVETVIRFGRAAVQF